MKPYQPDHPEFLINGAWGVELPREQAKQQGLVKWKGRWVEPQQKKQLKREYNAYYSIRVVGVLAILGGVVTLGGVAQGPVAWRLFSLAYSVVVLVSGVQVLRYVAWARISLLTVISLDLLLMIPGALAGTVSPVLPCVRIFFIAMFAYYLFNETARKIYAPPASQPAPTA